MERSCGSSRLGAPGGLPEWPGSGLQIRLRGFDSRTHLHVSAAALPGIATGMDTDTFYVVTDLLLGLIAILLLVGPRPWGR